MSLHDLGAGDQRLRPDHPSHAPAGHREGLADGVDHDGVGGDIRSHGPDARRRLGGVVQLVVDLVGDDEQVLLDREVRDGAQPLGGHDDARGVVRRVDDDAASAVVQRVANPVGIGLEPILRGTVNDHRLDAREQELRDVGHPRRGQDHDLVPRGERRERDVEERLLPAVRDQRVRDLAVDVPAGRIEVRDGPAQLGKSGDGRVAMLAELDGRSRSVDHGGGRQPVRLPRGEVDDAEPAIGERLRLRLDGERRRGGHGGEARGGSDGHPVVSASFA